MAALAVSGGDNRSLPRLPPPDYHEVERTLSSAVARLIQAEELLRAMGHEPRNLQRIRAEVEEIVRWLQRR
jgi:hypothetical protein